MLLADREVLQDQIVQVELHNEQLSQNNDMLRMEVQNLHLEREKVGAGVTGSGGDKRIAGSAGAGAHSLRGKALILLGKAPPGATRKLQTLGLPKLHLHNVGP